MTLRTKIEAACALVAVAYVTAIQIGKDVGDVKAEQRAIAALRAEHFAKAELASEKQISANLSAGLSAALQRVQATDPKVQPVSLTTATFALHDTAKAVMGPVSPGSKDCPQSVEDEYGRFHFDLTSIPLLTRTQLFRVEVLVVKRVGGKYELAKAEMAELNPKTKELIPSTGIDADIHFMLNEEQAAAPRERPLHPVIVAAADSSGVGAGVEFFRFKRLSLSALGLYDKSAKAVRGAVQLGYRLKFPWLDTNLIVGASYSTDQRIRPSGTVEITR